MRIFKNYVERIGGAAVIDFIELLYRKHKQLRQRAEIMWNEDNNLHLTSSEWFCTEKYL